jgi:hypothetical protein
VFSRIAPGDLDLDPMMPKNNRVLPYIMTNISAVLKNFTQRKLSYHLEINLWMDRRTDRVITMQVWSYSKT